VINTSNLISILTPIHNGEVFIPGLALNYKSQTMSPFQIFIGENASTDQTKNILMNSIELSDSVRLIEQKVKLEPHYSWLSLAQCVTTEYCLLLPVDDRLQPNYIEYAHHFLVNNSQTDLLASEAFATSNFEKLKSFSIISSNNKSNPHILSQKDVFCRLITNSLIPWHFTGLIIRTALYIEFLTDNSVPVFEGLGDVALSLYNFNRKSAIATRTSPKIVIFKHKKQESYRMRNKWLPDYLKLAKYALSLNNISNQYHTEILAIVIKLLIKNYFVCLLSNAASCKDLARLFWREYPDLISSCRVKFGNNFDGLILPGSLSKKILQKIVLRKVVWRILPLLPLQFLDFILKKL